MKKPLFLSLFFVSFAVVPVVLAVNQSVPTRSSYQQLILLCSLAAFGLLLGQFWLSRLLPRGITEMKLPRMLAWHKVIGYVAGGFMLLHPVLVVARRLWVAESSAADNLMILVRAPALLPAVVAWVLLLLIVAVSIFRRRLPARIYKLVHGICSAAFVGLAAWHVVAVGRHSNLPMSIYWIALADGAIVALAVSYFSARDKTSAQQTVASGTVPPQGALKRRDFMGLVGGIIAAVSSVGLVLKTQAAERLFRGKKGARGSSRKRLPEGAMQNMSTDVLVVGGGMAGVFAAVKAHDQGARVLLVDKGSVGKSGQTPFARGIFSYDPQRAGMSKSEFLARIAKAAEGMNNPAYTSLFLDHSAARCAELRSWGFFDAVNYAGALRKPLEERSIPLHERVMLTHLLKENGRVAGAMGLRIDSNESLVIRAKSVILCTGASGFKPAGWQIGSLTSDGDAMAYRIGAAITGKEWNDGHPMTNYGLDGKPHMVTRPGIAPMLGVETNVLVSKKGVPEFKGRPPGPPPRESKKGHPPMGHKPMGPPPGGEGNRPTFMGGASAGMAIHKAEGLFPVDAKCASNIPGLYAAGDSLGSMQSGGIYAQVGSSLAGSAVQGAVAGKSAAGYASKQTLAAVSAQTLRKRNREIYAPLLRKQGFSPQWVTQTLQSIMTPNFVLYVKSDARLKAALTYVEYLRDHQVPLLTAGDLHELRQAHETTNMVLNAEMKLRASLLRTETRGSHHREDYPQRNDAEWLAWIKIHRDADGAMKLTRVPVSQWGRKS